MLKIEINLNSLELSRKRLQLSTIKKEHLTHVTRERTKPV